jgi:hypothetical protein
MRRLLPVPIFPRLIGAVTMRLALALGVLALALGCTTQSAGQRCEQDQDCNGSVSEFCRSAVIPTQPCSGQPCVCCPEDTALAANIPGCVRSIVITDAGRRD